MKPPIAVVFYVGEIAILTSGAASQGEIFVHVPAYCFPD
jgi:hypothetical protein